MLTKSPSSANQRPGISAAMPIPASAMSCRPLHLPVVAASLSKLPLVCANQLLPFLYTLPPKSFCFGICLAALRRPLPGTRSARPDQENSMSMLGRFRVSKHRV